MEPQISNSLSPETTHHTLSSVSLESPIEPVALPDMAATEAIENDNLIGHSRRPSFDCDDNDESLFEQLAPELREFKMENGRTYHSEFLGLGPYFAPNDEFELARMDLR